jgi:hypothetical protein
MNACGHGRPVVFEKEAKTGGMFEALTNFRMNSANAASVESVQTPGPTRLPARSPSDDLNWLPNADEQVRALSGLVEYPYSNDMARCIQRALSAYAEVYTGVSVSYNMYGEVAWNGDTLGMSKRIVFAGGLVPRPDLPQGPAIMSGYEYMKRPVRELSGRKIAVIGGGDTAAQVAEIMLGQGITMPTTAPECIHWYGTEKMPLTKQVWMRRVHARWAGIGRALPDEGDDKLIEGVVKPLPVRAEVISLGNAALVNGQVYDMAVMCTGFVPAECRVNTPYKFKLGGVTVGCCTYEVEPLRSRVFKIGTAADITASYKPYVSRFPQAKQAIYNLAPRTAAIAAAVSPDTPCFE